MMALITGAINCIRDMIKRCVLTKTSKDKTDYQIVQVQFLGHVGDVESVVPYGLSNNPPLDSTGLMFNVQGNADNRAAFFNLPQERFKELKPGEVQIGNFITKSSVKFPNDKAILINSLGEIEIISAGKLTVTTTGDVSITATGNVSLESVQAVTIKAPTITLDGDVIITQDLTVDGVVTGDGINLSTHVHGGVSTGTENTGPPV